MRWTGMETGGISLADIRNAMTGLRPDETRSALVRKLGAMVLLTEEEIEFIEGLQNNVMQLPRGEVFIADGEPFTASFVIRSGWAVRYCELSDGRRQILSFALPGDFLGLHVNFRRRANYAAMTLGEAEIAAIEPTRLLEVSQRFPILSAGLSWSTAREFSILGDQAIRLGRMTSFERLGHLLLELWHRLELVGMNRGPAFDFPVTQQVLADTLGLSIVHLNRQLKRLSREGLIEYNRNSVRLLDIPRLEALTEFNPDRLDRFAV